jgi:hypothetical protein
MNTRTRHLVVVSTTAAGQPRTYRLVEERRRARVAAAYRRLAVAILGLDVAHLASELSRARQAA